jgi:L-fuconolactonase
MHRRHFIVNGAASGICLATSARGAAIDSVPVIDTHMHLFDVTRPQGSLYTGSRDYKGGVALPAMYDAVARSVGIVGAIAVEVSPWIEDNLWLLEQAQSDPMVVGIVGMLEPDKPDFPQFLERFSKNRLYRGIRYGNIEGFDIARQSTNPVFLDGLKRLAAADLTLDTANPDIALLQAALRIGDSVPDLRIIIDHLPGFEPKATEQDAYRSLLRDLGQRKNIYIKFSNIEHRIDHALVTGLEANRSRMDMMMDIFGSERVIFASNYPQSVGTRTVQQIVDINRAYFGDKPAQTAENVFWRNSQRFYKWLPRSPDQPG